MAKLLRIKGDLKTKGGKLRTDAPICIAECCNDEGACCYCEGDANASPCCYGTLDYVDVTQHWHQGAGCFHRCTFILPGGGQTTVNCDCVPEVTLIDGPDRFWFCGCNECGTCPTYCAVFAREDYLNNSECSGPPDDIPLGCIENDIYGQHGGAPHIDRMPYNIRRCCHDGRWDAIWTGNPRHIDTCTLPCGQFPVEFDNPCANYGGLQSAIACECSTPLVLGQVLDEVQCRRATSADDCLATNQSEPEEPDGNDGNAIVCYTYRPDAATNRCSCNIHVAGDNVVWYKMTVSLDVEADHCTIDPLGAEVHCTRVP